MAIQRDGKWIPIIDNHEMEVCTFNNHKVVKVEYDTKEEAEEKERKIKAIIDTLE